MIGQSVQDGQLVWFRSIRCPICGQIEEDGRGFLPARWRSYLLEREGEWQLLLDSVEARVGAIRVVREALELSLDQVPALLKAVPKLYVGTEAEAVWLQRKLEKAGIAAHAQRLAE